MQNAFAFPTLRAVLAVLTVTVLVAAPAGCGSGHRRAYRAGGKVVFKDGSPVPGGRIELSPIAPTADASGKGPPHPTGVIEKDGTFRLTTYDPFDGAPLGRYRTIVLELQYETKIGQSPPRPVIDPKYSRYDTSGLEVEILPCANDLTLSIARRADK